MSDLLFVIIETKKHICDELCNCKTFIVKTKTQRCINEVIKPIYYSLIRYKYNPNEITIIGYLQDGKFDFIKTFSDDNIYILNDYVKIEFFIKNKDYNKTHLAFEKPDTLDHTKFNEFICENLY